MGGWEGGWMGEWMGGWVGRWVDEWRSEEGVDERKEVHVLVDIKVTVWFIIRNIPMATKPCRSAGHYC